MRRSYLASILIFVALAVSGAVTAKEMPTETAMFPGETVAVGVTFTRGKDVLTFKDKKYPFKVDGLSAIGVRFDKFTGTGKTNHLKSVGDFAGDYGAASGGAALGQYGRGIALLRNANGVETEVLAQQRGASLNIDPSRLRIAMEQK